MTTLILPTRTDAARYDFAIDLEGEKYTFDFEWNDRDEGWYFNIRDSAGIALLTGRRVALDQGLTNIYSVDGLPPGVLLALDTSSTDTDPGFADLGDRVKLVYVPSTDL